MRSEYNDPSEGRVMKRLFGSIVDGFGLAAGKKLFDEAVEELVGEEDPAQAKKRLAAEAAELKQKEKERAAAAKKAAADQKRKEKELAAAAKKAAAEIDDELAALKRKLGK
jgi:hypothetical protein